jgi:hydrogenase maturation protein HypF
MEEIADAYSCSIDEDLIVHHDGLIREVVDDLRAGRTIGAMARRFHAAVVLSGVRLCEAIRDRTGMGTVVLGGGVFQNRIILKHFIRQLGQRDFSVYFANVLPPNDGGISYGQGITALAQLEGGAA